MSTVSEAPTMPTHTAPKFGREPSDRDPAPGGVCRWTDDEPTGC